jgi:hypothetical protein
MIGFVLDGLFHLFAQAIMPQSPTQLHQTIDCYVRDAQKEGYRIIYQTAWANGAGWIALAGPGLNGCTSTGGDVRHNRISLLVKFYPDGRFTSEQLGPSVLAASA